MNEWTFFLGSGNNRFYVPNVCVDIVVVRVRTSAFYVRLDSGSFLRGPYGNRVLVSACTRHRFLKKTKKNTRPAKKRKYRRCRVGFTRVNGKKNRGIWLRIPATAAPAPDGNEIATIRTGRIRPFRCGELNLDGVFPRPGPSLGPPISPTRVGRD